MPELVEQMYCSQQIVIPPKFPYILKRYCKAAIKTQPYDLLRWSFEYFRALSLHRPPPVKLRLEYPVFSTEGGLTRGCLKVLANQLAGMSELPLTEARAAWRGFCLDPNELRRVLCLCEVHLRHESVPFLHFIAVAGGLLTKSLTNTMILLCETLTKEPDGGSANIPLEDFLTMYRFLARMDASKDVKYLNGYREGFVPEPEEAEEEEESVPTVQSHSEESIDDFWDVADGTELMKLTLINDHVARSSRISNKLNQPLLESISRDPSVERDATVERENYIRESKGQPMSRDEVDTKLRQMSATKVVTNEIIDENKSKPKEGPKSDTINVIVYDPDGNAIPVESYGETDDGLDNNPNKGSTDELQATMTENENPQKPVKQEDVAAKQKEKITAFVSALYQERENRREDLLETFDGIEAIVEKYKSTNYDLGMVAGRQMSTTSGEFIVQNIEKEIMTYIDEQIAVLPDPDLKKKKAKPEEVAMVRDLLEEFLTKNMDIIVKEIEEVEEEEEPVPDVTMVYAVPGIGGPVDDEIVADFLEYAREVSPLQGDVFMPRNIRHFMCPPMEKFEEYKYDDDDDDVASKKEQVATGGVITD